MPGKKSCRCPRARVSSQRSSSNGSRTTIVGGSWWQAGSFARTSLAADAATSLSIAQSKTSISIAHPAGIQRYPRAVEHTYGAGGIVTGTGASRAHDVLWLGDEFVVVTTIRAGRLEPNQTEYGEGWRLQDDGRLRLEIIDNRSEHPSLRRTGALVYRR